MADQFQTTFIPKGNMGPSPTSISSKKKVKSIFTLITFIFFVLTIVAAGYIYLRQQLVQRNIDGITADLAQVRETVDDETIRSIGDLSTRLKLADELLENHIAPSEIFTLLQENTLETVGFRQFSYAYGSGDNIRISGSGVAAGTGSIVNQSDIYGSARFFRDVVFSNLIRNAETNRMEFTFEARIEKDAILFDKVVQTDGANVPRQNNLQAN